MLLPMEAEWLIVTRKIKLSMYKSGVIATFSSETDQATYIVQSITKTTKPSEMSSEDFESFWKAIRSVKIIEPDLSMASLDFIMAEKDGQVVVRFHDFSLRKDTPPQLLQAIVDIIQKYLPEQQQFVQNLI